VADGAVVSMNLVTGVRGYEARDVQHLADEPELAVIEQGLWHVNQVVARTARLVYVMRTPSVDGARSHVAAPATGPAIPYEARSSWLRAE
jgi:hypothetical protein